MTRIATLSLSAMFLALSGLRPAPAASLDSVRTGRATFYTGAAGRGACGLSASAPWDTLYAAVNRADWMGSLGCDACLQVWDDDGDSVTVRLVDRCPGCKPDEIDLSKPAFRRLSHPRNGRASVSWRFVACPDTAAPAFRRERGSSVHWASLRVSGLPWPAESLAVAGPDSGWIPFSRRGHNRFTARRLPEPPWTVRTVDLAGAVRVDSNLAMEPGIPCRAASSPALVPSGVGPADSLGTGARP